ncbi:MAG: MBL fold metallo-hydrolase [Oscillospiraceae bacterium]|nr:MBL fold metallo-hydrolase [Oscillospiraceae bacterium]
MDIFPKINGTVDNWDMIVMGHLRVNEYFGERRDAPPRGDPSTCTSVMVRGKDFSGKPYVLLIDATLRLTAADFDFDINRRTGLHISDATHCFVTHHHLDHYEALKYIPGIPWYAAPAVAELIAGGAKYIDGKLMKGVEGEFLPGVYALPLPGHTDTLHGVAFSYRGKRILFAADAVMSKYHFDGETTDFQPDPALNDLAGQTIRNMKESFDIVIPGHDNMIVV